eukprot:CAMPEP_0181500002 /NCGR_PEP_ID=MMETSP1110-20121109/54979_1 /TAXON_ID=174948 /ORGANISM="Symbiodinium sp., Strain CCMP421" /LENGTH=88 /DNA_ID=CAMNT_0023628265 /DNA_START=9 /DNA_END=272 /DNA_ORIENTATION=+
MVVPVELAHAVGFWSHRAQDSANRGWNVLDVPEGELISVVVEDVMPDVYLCSEGQFQIGHAPGPAWQSLWYRPGLVRPLQGSPEVGDG